MKRSTLNTGMRSILLTSFACLVGLSSQATVFAQPVQVGPSPKTTGIIEIGEMKANELGRIDFPLTNKGATSVQVTYTISTWNGSAWSALKTRNITLPVRGTDNQFFVVPRTKESQRVRLEVSAPGHISVAKELTMHAKRVYVVRYKTQRWVQIDYQYQRTTNELIGQGVNDKIAEAKALGFATKRKTDETTYVFGANAYRTYAYANADSWHEKTFNTKAEQDAFNRKLYSVVPSYTNDGPGLNTQLSER